MRGMSWGGDETLYDAYLDACDRGDPEPPEVFLARHPDASAALRASIDALYKGLREQAAAAEEVPFQRLGEFRLLKPLDAGGMGNVFLAEQESLGRVVALKVIRPERQRSEEARARFDREAHAVAQLRHENIVTVFGAGTDQGVRYLAMEMVPGRQLEDILVAAAAGREPVAIPRVVGWIARIARALDYAHQRGIVHRDVKPSNIRIAADDKPLLLDFGVAYDMSSDAVKLTRTFAGSPTYAAPEQIAGGTVDGRTDVYALGVTLYQSLTGVVPFSADTVEGVFHRALHEAPTPPRRLRHTVARELEIVTLKAMEKDPAARYESAGAFADDLEAILAYRPIRAKAPGPLEHLSKWARRRPARAVGYAGAAILLVALAVAFPLAAAAERSRQARELLDDARAGVERYRAHRDASEKLDLEVGGLERELHARWFTPEEDRRLLENQAAVRAARRARDETFYSVLELLRRAEQLEPGLDGADAIRGELFLEKWEEARRAGDLDAQVVFRDLVRRFAPERSLAATGRLRITSEPPAECYLFRYRELREIREAGERRLVPVPIHGGEPPVPHGTVVLRVVRGAGDVAPGDLVLEVAGAPVQGTMFGELEGTVRRIVSKGGQDIAGPSDFEDAGGPVVFEDGTTAETVEGLTPAALAERGGVDATVYHLGETRRVTLPAGLVVRTTAAPAFLSAASLVGTTPVDVPDLAKSDYLVVLHAAGCEELRFAVRVPATREVALQLLPAGSTPVGWIHVPADVDGPAFWIMEHEVTAGAYLAFLNASADKAGPRELVPRGPDEVYWQRGAGGEFVLPDDWRPDQPIVGVSFDDAQAYVEWARIRDGRNYALPTQLEWTRAAGERRLAREYPFGNVFMPKWASSNWSRKIARLEPVMRYPVDESPLGMFDASGSAMEWLDADYAGRQDSRWLAGGSWGHSDPVLFRIPGGWGASPRAAAGIYGFRMVLRP